MTPNTSFMEVLDNLNKGRTKTELSEGIRKLVAAVKDTGRAGKLTFRITLTPKGREADTILVDDEIKLDIPERERPSSLFYATEENLLSRKDPNQMEFKRVVGDDEDSIPEIQARKAS